MTLSLESSKRLAELGVKVETVCVWDFNAANGERYLCDKGMADSKDRHRIPSTVLPTIPSPIFEELWAVVPVFLEKKLPSGKVKQCGVCMDKSYKGDAIISYSYMAERVIASPDFRHNSPTEALGLLAIWLAENNHLKGV